MPDKPKEVGGGSATPVGNDWMRTLDNMLKTGQFANAPSGARTGGNPAGTTGTPGANPNGAMDTTGDFATAINSLINGGNNTYSNPNNPRPDAMVANLAGMQKDPMVFKEFTPVRSDAYNTAMGNGMSMAQQLQAFFTSMQNGGNLLPGPDSLSIGSFNSDGILGDRGNIANTIRSSALTQRNDAIANANERLTAMGGQGGVSTAGSFERAITNQRADQGLADALAAADLGYRNLDLGAYNAENNARLGNRNIDAYVHGNMLQALNSGNNLGLSALNTAGQINNNIMGNEFNQQQLSSQNRNTTNQLNLNSALGFNEQNSSNMTNAAQIAASLFGTQGNLDNQIAQLSQNGQLGILAQIFNSLNGAAQLGIPQAGTVMQQSTLGAIADFVPKAIGAGKDIFGANQNNGPGPSTSYPGQFNPNAPVPGTITPPTWSTPINPGDPRYA